MIKIKICGLKRLEDIEYVNQLKPNYIGFVFANTKRFVSKETAKLLKSKLSPEIQAVGVFVNEPIDKILELVNKRIIDIVQLHGDEDSDYIKELREKTQCKIIKAIRLKDEINTSDINKINADYLLFDTYVSDDIYGGTGKALNTNLIPDTNKQFFLAGGITTDNVGDYINTFHPYGIDVSSFVETKGIKDKNKIKEIIAKVRSEDEKR